MERSRLEHVHICCKVPPQYSYAKKGSTISCALHSNYLIYLVQLLLLRFSLRLTECHVALVTKLQIHSLCFSPRQPVQLLQAVHSVDLCEFCLFIWP